MKLFSRLLILTILLCGTARGQVRCEVEKMAGSNPDTNSAALGGYLVYPAGLPGAQIKDNITLPYNGTWYVWLRYLNNGTRPVSVTINGQTTSLTTPTPNGDWSWSYIRAASGSTVTVQIQNTGTNPGILDSLIFAPSSGYNPNTKGFADWSGYAEVLPAVGFAQGLIDQNPNITTADWINQVGTYYHYPPTTPAPVVDSYGNVLLNGQPWFQLGMFHAAVNDPVLNMVPELNNYLGWADASWPSNVTSVSSFWQLTTKYDYLAANFGPLAGRERLFYHYICDEPDSSWVSPAQLERLNALVKRMDPTKPTYINVSNSAAHNSAVLTIPDVVGIDYYPVPTSRWSQRISGVGQGIDLVRYFSNLRPTLFTAQSWTWGSTYPYPTPLEFRAMTWSALVHNARGLWFYQWPVDGQPGHTVATDQPGLWTDMKTTFGQIVSIRPALQGPEVVRPFTATVADPAGASPAEFRVAVNAARTAAYLIAVCPRQADEAWPHRVRLDFTGGPLTDIRLTSTFANQTAAAAAAGTGVWDVTFSSALGSGVFTITSAHLGELAPMTADQAKTMLRNDLGLAALRLEGEDFPGVATANSAAYVAGKIAYVGSTPTSTSYTLPAAAVSWDLATPWEVWVRYLDNGSRPLEVTVNGTTTTLASTTGNWAWAKLGTSMAYSTTFVTVGLRGTGSLPAMVDNLVFTNDPTFDPTALTIEQLNGLGRTYTVGPPVPTQLYGDSHQIALTAARPTFTADLSTYARFTGDLYAVLGNANTSGYADLMWTDQMYGSIGPNVVEFGSQAGWPYGLAVYKFMVPDTTVPGGTVSVRVRYLGTPSMNGDGYYLGVGTTFTPSGSLQQFNEADFTKATCAGPESFGVYVRTLTVPIPPHVSTFYVVLGKAYRGGTYDTLGAEAISVNAALFPTLKGTVIREGYVDDNSSVAVTFEFIPVGGGSTIMRQTFLNADGTFSLALDTIPAGTYTLAAKSEGSLRAQAGTVTVANVPVVLTQPIVLKGGDINGDNRITFEDFAILQNGFGRSGAAPAAAAAGNCGVLGILILTVLGLAFWRGT